MSLLWEEPRAAPWQEHLAEADIRIEALAKPMLLMLDRLILLLSDVLHCCSLQRDTQMLQLANTGAAGHCRSSTGSSSHQGGDRQTGTQHFKKALSAEHNAMKQLRTASSACYNRR